MLHRFELREHVLVVLASQARRHVYWGLGVVDQLMHVLQGVEAQLLQLLLDGEGELYLGGQAFLAPAHLCVSLREWLPVTRH